VDVPARALAARAYFRLSTRPVDQALAGDAAREHVLAGGYRLRDGSRLVIAVMGALVPEAMEAAEELGASVVCITSADLLFRAFQARAGLADGDPSILDELFGEPLPIVSLLDGHPHTLSFLAAIHGVPMSCLGVQRFGQSGDIGELYEHHQIDAESVIGAALDLLS
jgi:pyruvate dehydrogenase E1 component